LFVSYKILATFVYSEFRNIKRFGKIQPAILTFDDIKQHLPFIYLYVFWIKLLFYTLNSHDTNYFYVDMS